MQQTQQMIDVVRVWHKATVVSMCFLPVWCLDETLGKQGSRLLNLFRNVQKQSGRESQNNSWEYSERKMPLLIEFITK